MSGIEKRLTRLERAVSPPETVYLWADDEAMLEDAIAQRFPEGMPNGVTAVAYRWADADHERN